MVLCGAEILVFSQNPLICSCSSYYQRSCYSQESFLLGNFRAGSYLFIYFILYLFIYFTLFISSSSLVNQLSLCIAIFTKHLRIWLWNQQIAISIVEYQFIQKIFYQIIGLRRSKCSSKLWFLFGGSIDWMYRAGDDIQ